MTDTIFPIESAERFLRSINKDLERIGNSLRWSSHDGITELFVTPVNRKTTDGLFVTEEVVLRHRSRSLEEVTADVAGQLNGWATLSALVPAMGDTASQLISKACIFEGDSEAVERIYAPLICTEACVIGWHAARLARGQLQVDPELSPLNQTGQLPPYSSLDFAAVKVMTDERGFIGTTSERSLTVEFPWDIGAKSRMYATEEARRALVDKGASEEDLERLAGQTSIFQIRFAQHPMYGLGVESTLEIPYPPTGTRATQLVDELNRWELSGFDLPPLMGAWCQGPRAVAFLSFLPTQYLLPGLLQNLTVWASVRHGHVREWLRTTHEARSRFPN